MIYLKTDLPFNYDKIYESAKFDEMFTLPNGQYVLGNRQI